MPLGQGVAVEPEAQAQVSQLERRLSRLLSRDDAKYATGAIERARHFMQRASDPNEDPSAAARARQIATAAMTLAERQLERRSSQAELFATQRRLATTRERANAQRRVLEALMRERASLARAGEAP